MCWCPHLCVSYRPRAVVDKPTLEGGERRPVVVGPLRLSLGGVDGSWERVSRGKSSPSRSSGFLASCWNVVSSPPPIMTSERPRPPPPPLLSSSPVERASEVQWAKLVVMTYKVPYVYEIVYVLFPVACIGLTFETCTKFTSREREGVRWEQARCTVHYTNTAM